MSGNIYLGSTEYSVGEREGFVTITIKRDGDTSKAVSVSYATNPDGATPGADYTSASGSAVIAAGASSTTIRIPILNDNLSEPTESFNVSLINVDSGTLLFPRTTIVSILDDENPVVEPVNPPLVSNYSVKTVDAVTGLKGPMQIEWLEGKNIALVSEKEGRIKLVDFDSGKVVSTLLDISGKVNSDADRGLLDIALHPDLKNNPYLYAYYVVDPADVKATGAASADNLGNRYAHLVRYELDMSGSVPTIKPGTETVMLGGSGKSLADISGGGALDFTDPIHSGQRSSDMNSDGTYKQDYIKVDSRSHAGGAIAFGPDGALYVSTGDGTSYNYADPRTASVQNVDSLSGKILRIDPITGDGFADNPYTTTNLGANASKVWQMGLRNPYAMTFTDDGRIMISETGWYSWEEINSGGKGANYGWPYYEGADNGEVNKTPGYQTMPGASQFYADVASGKIVVTPAFRAFSHEARDPGYDMQAIVGGTSVYDGNKYPAIFKGDYFFSDIVDGDIFTVDVNDRTQMQFVTNIGTYHAVSFVQGPDGYVYYSDITGNKIVRLEITDPNATANHAPVVTNPPPTQGFSAGSAFDFSLAANTFTDPDGDKLALSARLANGAALPDWLKFDAATGRFHADKAVAGAFLIAVTATDTHGATVTQQLRVEVSDIKPLHPPVVATPIADQTSTDGTPWSFKLPANTFTDADNDVLTLSATQANGQTLPGWVAFNAQTGTFSGTPPAGTTGNFTLRVTATDTTGLKTSDDFVLTIAGPSETIVKDTAQNQFATGTSANDVFVYAGASSLYQWGPSADGKSIVVWTRATNDDKFDVLTGFEKLRFSDKTVVLGDLNPAGPDYRDVADTIQQLVGTTAADRFIVNGKSSDYAWGNTADGKSLVIWTVSNTDDTYDILTAFDQLVFTDKTVYLTGAPPANSAPKLVTPIADHTVHAAGYVFGFDIPEKAFVDADGDKLTYSATQADGSPLPNWLKLDAATGHFSGQAPKFETISVRVTASDGKGGTASDVFDLKMPANNPPVVSNPVADQTFKHGESFSINLGQTFTDPDNDGMLFFVTLADGSPLPSWIIVGNNGRILTGTAPADAGPLSIKVSASDRNGGGASDVFVIKFDDANHAPVVANPLVDQKAIHTWSFSFAMPANTFSDADGDALSVSAKLAGGAALPDWLKFDAGTRTFTGFPVSADVGKTFAVAVTASDGKGGMVTDTFDIHVEQFDRPPRVFTAIADQTGTAGTAFTFTVPNGTFADDNIVSYSATLNDGSALPSWLKFDVASRTFSGTAPGGQGASYDIKVTAHDASGGTGSDVFKLTIGAKPVAETLYQNTAANQNIDAGDGHDVFVMGGNSSAYSWGPTKDGKGVVIWNDKGFDVLFNFEELRFTNKGVSVASVLGNGGSDFLDDADTTQYLTGKTAADRFIIDGDAADYSWGSTQDGKGVVVWDKSGDNPHDILTGFEKLVFDDQTIDISGLGHV